MVTVTGFKTVHTEDGSYVRLILEGDLEMIQSAKTNNFYAHTKRASVSSTFNEQTAELMIGKTFPGSIVKQAVEPYEFEINGETLTLNHRWVYTNKTTEQLAVDNLVEEANSSTKMNGKAEDAIIA